MLKRGRPPPRRRCLSFSPEVNETIARIREKEQARVKKRERKQKWVSSWFPSRLLVSLFIFYVVFLFSFLFHLFASPCSSQFLLCGSVKLYWCWDSAIRLLMYVYVWWIYHACIPSTVCTISYVCKKRAMLCGHMPAASRCILVPRSTPSTCAAPTISLPKLNLLLPSILWTNNFFLKQKIVIDERLETSIHISRTCHGRLPFEHT